MICKIDKVIEKFRLKSIDEGQLYCSLAFRTYYKKINGIIRKSHFRNVLESDISEVAEVATEEDLKDWVKKVEPSYLIGINSVTIFQGKEEIELSNKDIEKLIEAYKKDKEVPF